MALKRRLVSKLTRQRLRQFLESQATDMRLLEIGAKHSPYRDLFPRAITSDLVNYPTLDLQLDAHRLPFADSSLPAILCAEVLEHCTDPQRVIDECHRVLMRGGKLILTTRFIFPIHDAPQDYFRFTKYGLAHLCRAFDAVTMLPELDTVGTLAAILQRLAAQARWRLPGTRTALQVAAHATLHAQWTLREEYADVGRHRREEIIMTSGYYLVAIKGQ